MRRSKACVAHTERLENILLRKLFECHFTDSMYNLTQRYVIDVAIYEASAWWCAEGLFYQMLDGFIVTDPLFAQIKVRRVS